MKTSETVQELAEIVCFMVNKAAKRTETGTSYKCQEILEELIKELQSRI
jgi:hypothetical protein